MRLYSFSLNHPSLTQTVKRRPPSLISGRPSTLSMHPPTSTNSDGKSLLFVDDDRLVLGTLAEGLRDSGYAVVTADCAKAALEYAATSHFELAILDVRIPSISGIDLAASLRDEFNISSMFLSAFDDQHTVDMAIREGGLGYLVKPVTVAKLIPAIEAALARAQDLKKLANYSSSLEKALSSNRLTSVAIGILMAELGLTEGEAFEHLRNVSRNQRQKMEVVAEKIVDSLYSSRSNNDE
jgi:AmiR/NasT family two-component response regulator